MKTALALAASLAMPVSSSDGPTFRVGIACDGGLPALIQIEAMRPGAMRLTLVELLAFCADARPEKQKWQGGA